MKGRGDEATEPRPSSNWAELIPDCLINIFSPLTLEQRWTSPMLVCKSWLSASKDPLVNSVFDLETHFESISQLPRRSIPEIEYPLFDFETHLEEIPQSPRWWFPKLEKKIDSMLLSVIEWSARSLTEIKTRHCSDRSLNSAAEMCPNLEVLSIKSCPNVTDYSLCRLASQCPKLRELDISYCYGISPESLTNIGRNCRNLKVLKRNLLNWLDPYDHSGNVCPHYGDSEAHAIAKFMPNLEHLEIRFSKLSAKSLASICEACTKLESLDLSGCSNVTSQDIANSTSNLKSLKQIIEPNVYIPRLVFHRESFVYWRLYDERFRTHLFQF